MINNIWLIGLIAGWLTSIVDVTSLITIQKMEEYQSAALTNSDVTSYISNQITSSCQASEERLEGVYLVETREFRPIDLETGKIWIWKGF